MNKERAKKWEKEIAHWANSGNLWYLGHSGEWYKYDKINPTFDTDDKTAFIIQDKHFEARKAFALGESIECKRGNSSWIITNKPQWNSLYDYRLKPKEWYDEVSEDTPVLCWVWGNIRNEGHYAELINKYKAGDECMFESTLDNNWENAEPVKTEECWKG